MPRPRLLAFAGTLRRVADHFDPPAPPAPAGEEKFVSREELRRIQSEGMRMLDDWLYLSRCDARNDGLMWIATTALTSIAWLVEVEIEVRARDFEKLERDPRVVLR